MKLKLLAAFSILILSVCVNATQKSDYLKFFNNYQKLGNSYDVAVAELYSDDAKVVAVRKMQDGIEQKRGDKSEFKNIHISSENDKAKITASRYSTEKCFHDNHYYMVVGKGKNGELQIIEEHMESPVQTNCKTKPKNDLSLVLQGSVKMINKQLPIMVDSDTKLEHASSQGNTLIYHYELVNYMSSDINAEVFEQNLKPIVIQQTCTMPNLTPVIEQGGTVSYRYNGNDDVHILSINVDKSSCT